MFSKGTKEIIENSSADYWTKQIICSVDCKTFLKSVKETENSSADYQTRGTICLIDFKTF